MAAQLEADLARVMPLSQLMRSGARFGADSQSNSKGSRTRSLSGSHFFEYSQKITKWAGFYPHRVIGPQINFHFNDSGVVNSSPYFFNDPFRNRGGFVPKTDNFIYSLPILDQSVILNRIKVSKDVTGKEVSLPCLSSRFSGQTSRRGKNTLYSLHREIGFGFGFLFRFSLDHIPLTQN